MFQMNQTGLTNNFIVDVGTTNPTVIVSTDVKHQVVVDPKHIVGTCITNNDIWFNGTKLPAPPKSAFRGTAVEIINNKIWVSGWYWNGSEWIRMSRLRFKLMRMCNEKSI